MQLFVSAFSSDRSFEQLTLQWRDCYQRCCCGRTEAATRLSAAMNRVDRRQPLPPWGEPLLGDEEGPINEAFLHLLSDLAVHQAVMANLNFLLRPEGAPLMRLNRASRVLRSYKHRHIIENGRLPAPLSEQGFELTLLSAFFSYVCMGCGRSDLADTSKRPTVACCSDDGAD